MTARIAVVQQQDKRRAHPEATPRTDEPMTEPEMETPTPTRRSPAERKKCEHCGKNVPNYHTCYVVEKKLKCFRCGEPNHLAVVCSKAGIGGRVVFDVKQQPTVNTIEEKLRAEVERLKRALEGATTTPRRTQTPLAYRGKKPRLAPQGPRAPDPRNELVVEISEAEDDKNAGHMSDEGDKVSRTPAEWAEFEMRDSGRRFSEVELRRIEDSPFPESSATNWSA